jgi:predicted dehydrogenase
MNLSRRQAIASGFASMGAAALQAQDQPVKLGIIGLGNRGNLAHVKTVKELNASEAKITAICDIQPNLMQKINEGLPAKAATYVDYRELIKDPNVSIVVVATPGYLHHDMALAVLRAGKDLILEKPLSLNYKDAMDVVREAERSGRIVAVGMQRRYTDADELFQAALDKGMIGAVKMIIYSEFRGDWAPTTWHYPDPETGKSTVWRRLAKTAGSTELEFSIHALAMVSNMVKSPLVRAAASGGVVHYKDGRDTRDVVSIIGDFANGARLDYTFNLFAQGVKESLTVIGDTGTLQRAGNKSPLMRIVNGKAEEVKMDLNLPPGTAEVRMYREFFKNVRDRKQSAISPRVALEPAKIAYASDISIRENRIVTSKDFA